MKYVQKYNIITPKYGGASAPPKHLLVYSLGMHVHKYMHTHLISVWLVCIEWCYAYHKSTLLQLKEGFLYHE